MSITLNVFVSIITNFLSQTTAIDDDVEIYLKNCSYK